MAERSETKNALAKLSVNLKQIFILAQLFLAKKNWTTNWSFCLQGSISFKVQRGFIIHALRFGKEHI
jgi:hypothetical protein